MAKVKIEAISGSGTTWFYDLSNIPPLDDNRYVEQYNKTIANVKILWRYNMGPDTRWGIIHKIDGEEHCRKVTNGSETPAEAWRNIDISEMMIHVTDREPGDGLTQLDVYYYDGVKVDEGNPYLEVDLVTIPITVSNPNLSNVTLSRDKPIILTWEHSGSPQYEYEIKYIHNGIETIKKVQSNAQSHTFAIGELPEGKITYQIRLSNGFEWSNWTPERTFTTFANKVISFEPDGVAQNKDYEITATWSSSEPYTKFEFEYSYGQGTNLITGTTESSYVFPDNFFGVETVGMRVRTYNGYVWSEWKTASFITYGKPEIPTMISTDIFDTAYPTFEWESIGQTGYNLQVLDDEVVVYDTGDIVSSARYHSVTKALDNNKTYTLRLSIKNQYGYNSDYTFQFFKISYTELQKPTFNIFQDYINGVHIIDIANIDDEIFKECEVHRKEEDKDWVRIAKGLSGIAQFRDITIRSNTTYYYKVRAISTTDGITDSDIKLSYTLLKYAQLLDLATNETIPLKVNFKSKIKLEQDMSEKLYAGRSTPVVNYGEKKYKVIDISFAVKTRKDKEQFERLYYSRPTLLYRDNKGEKMYCWISVTPTIIPTKNYWTIEFTVTELSYSEGV